MTPGPSLHRKHCPSAIRRRASGFFLRGTRECGDMLTLLGRTTRFCDGLSRRGFLQIGTLGLGASCLSLADLFRAEARAGTARRHKSVINIFLAGGPAHQDTWDIKTEAPAEIRGEFRPIPTRL